MFIRPVTASKALFMALAFLCFCYDDPFQALLGLFLSSLLAGLLFFWSRAFRRAFFLWPLFCLALLGHEWSYRPPLYSWPMQIPADNALVLEATVQKVSGEKVALVDLSIKSQEKMIWPVRRRARRSYNNRKQKQKDYALNKRYLYSRRRPSYAKQRRLASAEQARRPGRAHWQAKGRTGARPLEYATISHFSLPAFREVIVLKDFTLQPGCRIKFRLFGKGLPRKLENKNSFQKFLKTRGARSSIFIAKSYLLRRECPSPVLRKRILDEVGQRLFERLPENLARIGFAMTSGNYRHLDESERKLASATGVLHLFAASGLHAGIVYAFFLWPAGFMAGRKRPIILLYALVPPLLYLYLLNFPISLLRAFSFMAFYSASRILGRPLDRADLILNSALACLLFSGREFFSAGALLSFGAIAGILYFYAAIEKLLSWKNVLARLLASQLALTASASLFTLPVIALLFGQSSQSGFYFNALLVPLTGFLLPLLLGTLALELAGPGAPEFCWQLLLGLLGFFEYVVARGSIWNVSQMGWIPVALASGLLLLCLLLQRRNRGLRWLAIALLVWQAGLIRPEPAAQILAQMWPELLP